MGIPSRRAAITTGAAALSLLLLLAGCGTARPGGGTAPRQDPGWSVELASLLPAIRACLAADGAAAAVTGAWPMARDLAGVRILRADGGRSDCVAAADGRRVVLTEPVPAGSRRTLEEAPLFTPRDRGEPPRGPCVATVPAVVGAERVGWLSYTAPAATCDVGQVGPTPSAGRRGGSPTPPARPPLPSV